MFLLQKRALNFLRLSVAIKYFMSQLGCFMIYFVKTLRCDNFSLQLRCSIPIKTAITVIHRFMFDQLAIA